MSDALIASLNTRIQQLEGDKANLNAALKETRRELKATASERQQFAETIETLDTERAEWEAKANQGPEDLMKEIGELKGQLSGRDHKDSFKQAAAKAGVKPDLVDDLYGLSGLKPGDQPAKPEDFADFLSTAKESRKWAFGEGSPAGGSTGAEQGQTLPFGSQAIQLQGQPPVPGGGRGASDNSSGLFTARRSDAKDVAWMQTNGKALGEAASKGTLRWTD